MMNLRAQLELLREIEAVGRRLIEMGLLEGGDCGALEAHTEAIAVGGADVPGDRASRAGAGALAAQDGSGARSRERRCRRCRKTFVLKLRGARKIYCSAKCRSRAGGQQRREREQARAAEFDRQTAAGIVELSRAEGYDTPAWGNGNAETTEDRAL